LNAYEDHEQGTGDGGVSPLPLALMDLVDDACDCFEAEWRGGGRPRIETYLSQAPASAISAMLLELLILELELSRATVSRPSDEEFRARFPAHAAVVDAALASCPAIGTTGLTARQTLRNGDGHATTVEPAGRGRSLVPTKLPTVPGYEILGELGRGGMGVVYLARAVRLNRVVALKMLLPGGLDSPEAVARFRAEAETVARLQHPNVVRVHAVGEHAGLPYFEMEYVIDGSLAAALDGVPWDARRAARLVELIASGVGEVHRVGVVHRDLKPANVLIGADGTPKISDFGLARTLEEDSGLTRTGSVLGSPSYMAPEQAEGGNVRAGPAADVYSLGAIFYELLTGRPPFRAATVLETLQQVKSADPVAPSRLVPGLARDAETIALKCLAKSPTGRYASAAALAEDLGRYCDNRSILARRTGPAGQLARWCRRNPGMAVLAAVVAFLALTVTLVSLTAAVRLAAAAAKERRTLYVARMNLIQQAWEAADIPRMRELLAPYQNDPPRDDLRGFEWFYWWRLAHAPEVELSSNGPGIELLAYSADGSTLASADTAGTIVLWDIAKRAAVSTLTIEGENTRIVRSLAFGPDGAALAAGLDNGVILVWGRDGRQLRCRLAATPEAINPKAAVMALRFLDATTLVAAYDPNTNRTWDLVKRSEVDFRQGSVPSRGRVDDNHRRPHALSADGKLLAVGGQDGRVTLRETEATRSADSPLLKALLERAGQVPMPPSPDRTLRVGELPVRSLTFSPDSASLALGCDDSSIQLMDVISGQRRDFRSRHTAAVWSFAFSPDGKTLAAASLDNTVSIWDVGSGRLLTTAKGHGGPLLAVVFSPDGRSLASGCTDGVVKLWGVERWERDGPQSMQAGGIDAVALSPDGACLAAGGRDGRVSFRDVETGKELSPTRPTGPSIHGHASRICAMTFSRDGRTLFTAGWNSPIRLWDVATRTLTDVMMGDAPTIPASGGTGVGVDDAHSVIAMALAPDGGTLVASYKNGRIIPWDLVTRTPRPMISFGIGWANSLAFSPDGNTIAAAGGDGPIELFALHVADPPRRLGGADRASYRALAFSPDGKALASGDSNGILTLWDVSARQPRAVQRAHTNWLVTVAFTPDGRTLASGGRDNVIRLWNVSDGELASTLRGHTGNVMALEFTADGKTLASGSLDDTTRLWRAALSRNVPSARRATSRHSGPAQPGLP
jgi:eukaryotic-like serine/threonine-protein kinase